MKPVVSLKGGKTLSKKLRDMTRQMTSQGRVLIGVPKAAGAYEDGTPVALIAAVHEFGSSDGRVPERSFLRVPLRAKRKEISNVVRQQLPAVVNGDLQMSTLQHQVGAYAVGVVQQAIAEGIAPPNAPSTVARKGSSKPLIDTGHMRQSITYVVEGEGDGA
jgi:phage gpG-like protein